MSAALIFGLLFALMLTGMPISISLGLTVLTFDITNDGGLSDAGVDGGDPARNGEVQLSLIGWFDSPRRGHRIRDRACRYRLHGGLRRDGRRSAGAT